MDCCVREITGSWSPKSQEKNYAWIDIGTWNEPAGPIIADDYNLLIRRCDDVSDIGSTDVRKIQRYVDGAKGELGGKNILDPDAGIPPEKQVVRCIDAREVRTRVGDVEVDDLFVVKKGDIDGNIQYQYLVDADIAELKGSNIERMRGYAKGQVDIDELKAFKNLGYDELLEVDPSGNLLKRIEGVRDNIPPPNTGTGCTKYMTKVDLDDAINKNKFRGFFAKTDDVSDIANPQDAIESLRLNGEVGSKYNADNIVRVKWDWEGPSENAVVPTRKMHPTYDDSFTGNGFTSSRNGRIIPEWEKMDDDVFPSNPTYEVWNGNAWVSYTP